MRGRYYWPLRCCPVARKNNILGEEGVWRAGREGHFSAHRDVDRQRDSCRFSSNGKEIFVKNRDQPA